MVNKSAANQSGLRQPVGGSHGPFYIPRPIPFHHVTASDLRLPYLGHEKTARAIAARATKNVRAYSAFLDAHNFNRASSAAFDARPITDKANYLLAHTFADLLADDFRQTFFLLRSSGSSGRSFYWPQLKGRAELTGPMVGPYLDALFSTLNRLERSVSPGTAAFKAVQQTLASAAHGTGPRSFYWPPVRESYRYSPVFLRSLMECVFDIDRKPTMAVVGLALGSWIGGDHFSWALKNMAIDCPYPFCVFSPGNVHEEIIEVIHASSSFVDQVVLFVCPSAIAHLSLRAEEAGRPLPFERLRFVVIGEPFPEALRSSLQRRSGASGDSLIVSIYGSADTGGLGFESPATIALRRLLDQNRALGDALGVGAPVPHFFHCNAPDAFLEVVNGELCVTRWQGIPLVRYNLHDDAMLLSWRRIRQAVLESSAVRAEEQPLVRTIERAGWNLPDLVAIRGRADRCLILCGTNVTESMLDEAVKSQELEDVLTGVYQASVEYEGERQFLSMELELKDGVRRDSALLDRLYDQLVRALGRVQPEFLTDWQNIYRQWDNDRERRVLRLTALEWPTLSQRLATSIKHRGIRK